MRVVALIQARCGSTRLKNKVLMPLAGKPALLRVVERVSKSVHVDEAMVITSINKENLPIVKMSVENDIRVFVGSENDVLDRYYQAAKLLEPEYVIRITGDCPLIDPGLIDLALEQIQPDVDYMGMLSETFADGLDIEIFKYSALVKAWREADRSFEREHVTQFIIRRPEVFKQQDFVSPVGYFGEKRWTLDEQEDYELLSAIYAHFEKEGKQESFNYIDVLNYLKENPELEKINRKFSRNEGLAKSIREDRIVGEMRDK